jgi:hypothetical protein
VLAPHFVAADLVFCPVVSAADFISPCAPVVLLPFGLMAYTASVVPAPSKISFFPFVASVIFAWEPLAAVLHQFHSWLVFALAT